MEFQDKLKKFRNAFEINDREFLVNYCSNDKDFLIFLNQVFFECNELQLQYFACKRMALRIFVQAIEGKNKDFEPTKLMKAFQEYMYAWSRIPEKVPYEDIVDIYEKGLGCLKLMIEHNELENFRKSKHNEEFKNYYMDRSQELHESHKYPSLQFYMDGEG